jgi:pimeloyl-ACP methyl ester carboxylesterase
MNKTIIFCLAFALLLGIVQQTNADNPENITGNMLFQEITIELAGTAATRADYIAGKNPRAVIFAPGAMFSKESWHFLAARFQDLEIGSVALDSGSPPDLLNGLAFLKAKGVEKIAIIGASAGGAGVLYTLRDTPDPLVDKVVLLAPAGGPPLQNDIIRKLFIVAEDDMISSSAEVYKLYKSSSDPKLYRELKGSDHAQRLFDSKEKENIIQLIIQFIQD